MSLQPNGRVNDIWVLLEILRPCSEVMLQQMDNGDRALDLLRVYVAACTNCVPPGIFNVCAPWGTERAPFALLLFLVEPSAIAWRKAISSCRAVRLRFEVG